jgi:TPP-dependent pyruvate/acetoin dehydrogenase alpha subunit
MTLVPIVDNVLYQSQRQGRISFYMQCAGEEAATVGSAAAMLPNDEMYGQYVRPSVVREQDAVTTDMDDRESRLRCCIEDSPSRI